MCVNRETKEPPWSRQTRGLLHEIIGCVTRGFSCDVIMNREAKHTQFLMIIYE